MERSTIKIGILTSSRADFGIYQPLIKALKKDARFEVELIVFGTHLSPYHGLTLQLVEKEGLPIHKVYGMSLSDAPQAIANAYGLTVSNFSQFWANHSFDWVFALGDRFEMAAAVQAGIPQRVRFAHFHGGETTLGAIDNIYRHQISLASDLHFVATPAFAQRVEALVETKQNIHWVGALSLSTIDNLQLPDWQKVQKQFHLTTDDFILVTFHPETIAFEKNEGYSKVAANTLLRLSKDYDVIITMPNADTAGSLFRHQFQKIAVQQPERIFLIENFGRLNYFAAAKQSKFLLGNTSSGIIEAASFGKYVINVGDRQKGRPQSDNTFSTPFQEQEILHTITNLPRDLAFKGTNIYFKSNCLETIIDQLIHAKYK
ncbi:MAG: UDP-N-acetylglucosamine 2-epimerase [Saprospiraceae bacterium]|jgi:GDP/UDP-N,N'-diacetylbacillosamine 2-epimerase (hydrolysing)|nr:UDP-N-acetylglucosamine 2-epimerase [Saprospiraceae bacterium]